MRTKVGRCSDLIRKTFIPLSRLGRAITRRRTCLRSVATVATAVTLAGCSGDDGDGGGGAQSEYPDYNWGRLVVEE